MSNILSQYDIIGFQDDIPSFIDELKLIANIESKYNNEVINNTEGRIKIKERDQNILERISKKNSLDIAFFDKLLVVKNSPNLRQSCITNKKNTLINDWFTKKNSNLDLNRFNG